jgi:hypothetical protein
MPRIQKMKILLLFFTFFSGALGAGWWYLPPASVHDTHEPRSLYGDPYEKMVYFPWASCLVDTKGIESDEDYHYYADNCFLDDGKGIKFKMPAN